MRIETINSTNFKGLWSIDKKEEASYIKNWGKYLYYREASYHPFSDETQEEIEEQMKKANENLVYEGGGSHVHYSAVYITKPSLGEKMSITKAQYHEISNMQTAPHPISNDLSYYYPSSRRCDKINEIIDKINKEKGKCE